MHPAFLGLAPAHASVAHAGPATTTLGAVLSISVPLVFVLLSTALIIASRLHHPGPSADEDADSGPGGGGGGWRRPDGPRSPQGDPAWWPEFERQFAAYVAGRRRRVRIK